ncbi:ribosome biogenesis GTPase YqeH [Facklamia sp. P12934]|uniref:ribosome biogenesis GTPase YqeH n=1 Tax=unclassified Facklamia TaxID=2622293 RepID=UPI003D172DA6
METGGTNLKDQTNLQENYQCIGCGAEIQSEDPNKMGYLLASIMEKKKIEGDFYCQRCFRLRHYNELQDVQISDDIFLDRLSSISEDDAFVVNVIDIFDVEGSMLSGLNRFIGKQPFVLVANKVDLLPKSVKQNRIVHWLKQRFFENSLKPDEVYLLSANKPASLQALIDRIDREVRQRNVYIVGVTNVGKSTLINQLLRHYGGDKEIITTSDHPGTTLDTIRIPLTETTGIIDTPGIIKENQLAHYLDRQGMKKLLPNKAIKPRTFQLNAGQTLFLAGAGRVDFIAGERAAFTFYVSNETYIHRTKTDKADDFYLKHKGQLLSPPYLNQAVNFPELQGRDYQLKPNQDLAIAGLGWLTVNEPVQVRLWAPKAVQVTQRESMI